MKQLLIAMIFTVLFALAASCEMNALPAAPNIIDGTIVAVLPHHATRILIIIEKDGKLHRETIHQSVKITDGRTTIDPHDHLPNYGGTKKFGIIIPPLPEGSMAAPETDFTG